MMLSPLGARPAVSVVLPPVREPAALPALPTLAAPPTAVPLASPAGAGTTARPPGSAADEAELLPLVLHAASSRQPAIRMAPLSAPRLARTACVMHLGRAGRRRGSGSGDNRCRDFSEDRAARAPGGNGPGRDLAGDSPAQRRRAPGRHCRRASRALRVHRLRRLHQGVDADYERAANRC